MVRQPQRTEDPLGVPHDAGRGAHANAFVAVSVFEVRNDKDDEVAKAFKERPHRVDDTDGFLSLEVLRGRDNPKLFWLVTRWRDEQCYIRWHRGHTYSASHAGIPKGLKLVKHSASVHAFDRICE